MSNRCPYDFHAAEDLCSPLDVTATRRLRVRYLPAKSASYAPALDVRRFDVRADGTEAHAAREGFVVALDQIDDFIGMLLDARDRLRASGRLSGPTSARPFHASGQRAMATEKRPEVHYQHNDALIE